MATDKTVINRQNHHKNTVVNTSNQENINQITYSPITNISAGTLIDNKYKITEAMSVDSGEAELYRCERGGDKYVFKIYKRLHGPKGDVLDKLAKIDSPLIAKLIDTGEYNQHTYEVWPYYEKGSLDNVQYNLDVLKNWIIPQVNDALNILHSNGILHKDLKPSNIMRTDDGIALIDFGISSQLKDGQTVAVTKVGMTAEYAADETHYGVYLDESDYYSFGITLYKLFCGYTPYSNLGQEEILRFRSLAKLPFPDNMPTELKNLIEALTYRDITNRNDKNNPNRRWTYHEVKKWLEGVSIPLPGTQNTNASMEDIPGYWFSGKTYKSIDSLTKALAINWDNGKRELFRNKLSDHFKKYDRKDIAEKCSEAVQSATSTDSEDILFFDLLYNLSPNLTSFHWKGESFDSLKEFALDIQHELSRDDFSKKSYWNSVLTNHIVSKYLNHTKQPDNICNIAKNIEDEFLAAPKQNEETSYLRIIYTFSGNKSLMVDDISFETPRQLVEYVCNLIDNRQMEQFYSLAKNLIRGNGSYPPFISPKFREWLKIFKDDSNINEEIKADKQFTSIISRTYCDFSVDIEEEYVFEDSRNSEKIIIALDEIAKEKQCYYIKNLFTTQNRINELLKCVNCDTSVSKLSYINSNIDNLHRLTAERDSLLKNIKKCKINIQCGSARLNKVLKKGLGNALAFIYHIMEHFGRFSTEYNKLLGKFSQQFDF